MLRTPHLSITALELVSQALRAARFVDQLKVVLRHHLVSAWKDIGRSWQLRRANQPMYFGEVLAALEAELLKSPVVGADVLDVGNAEFSLTHG